MISIVEYKKRKKVLILNMIEKKENSIIFDKKKIAKNSSRNEKIKRKRG
jgi:hypothetical protein